MRQPRPVGFAAPYVLAGLYRDGEGVKRNLALAQSWLTKAAAQGDVAAQTMLASLLETGDGVPKDVPRAVTLYKAAAARGHVAAMVALSRLYLNGQGVAHDGVQALVWATTALSTFPAGMPDAIPKDVIEAGVTAKKPLSPADIETANHVAVVCVQTHYRLCDVRPAQTAKSD